MSIETIILYDLHIDRYTYPKWICLWPLEKLQQSRIFLAVFVNILYFIPVSPPTPYMYLIGLSLIFILKDLCSSKLHLNYCCTSHPKTPWAFPDNTWSGGERGEKDLRLNTSSLLRDSNHHCAEGVIKQDVQIRNRSAVLKLSVENMLQESKSNYLW